MEFGMVRDLCPRKGMHLTISHDPWRWDGGVRPAASPMRLPLLHLRLGPFRLHTCPFLAHRVDIGMSALRQLMGAKRKRSPDLRNGTFDPERTGEDCVWYQINLASGRRGI